MATKPFRRRSWSGGNRRPRTALGHRSKFEDAVSKHLEAQGAHAVYEPERLPYAPPMLFYTPDWKLPNGVYIEAKGWFKSEDRTKLLSVKKSYPDLDLRLLFMKASTRISKTSKTTYAQWAAKHGFPWACWSAGGIPKEWLRHGKPNPPKRSDPG